MQRREALSGLANPRPKRLPRCPVDASLSQFPLSRLLLGASDRDGTEIRDDILVCVIFMGVERFICLPYPQQYAARHL